MERNVMQFNNKNWQVFRGDNSTYYLYAAYLDIRPKNKFERIRVNGIVEKDKERIIFWEIPFNK